MFHPPRIISAGMLLGLMLGLLCLGTGGCSRIGQFAKKRADRAAYGIVAEKQAKALGRAEPFTIEESEDETTRDLLKRAERLDWANDAFTTPTTMITLAQALALAVANSRDYKSQRETLFAQALTLTETRRDFGVLYAATALAHWDQTNNFVAGTAGSAGESFGTRGFTAGVTRLLATGAQVGLDFSHQFVRSLDGKAGSNAANTLAFSVVQPLMNGLGPLVTLEPLRQRERNMIYAVRSFRRYQQSFIIDVATRYYALLAAQDQLHNALRNYESSQLNWSRLKHYAEGKRSTEIEVGQARQKVLEAEAGLSSTQKDYSRQLDQFKYFLGLPIDLDVGPDTRELEAIAARGLLRPEMTLRDAVQIALDERLDLANTRDAAEDNERQLKIAEQNFLPTLNAFYNYSATKSTAHDGLQLDFKNHDNQFGFDLALPLDWTVRRNNYRLALLARGQARRSYEQARDALQLEVRDAWRELEEQRTNYRIQQEASALAERQVRSTSMLLQMGRATPRDLLEAQDNLLLARNAATSALIAHTIQRLRFWNSIERLAIDSKGMWHENPNLAKP